MEKKRNIILLSKIRHIPIIFTKIFEYSLSRPFILSQLLDKSHNIKDKLEKFKLSKNNELPKQYNYLHYLFFNTLKLDSLFIDIMRKKIDIELEEKNYYITKPNLNLLYEENFQKLFDDYKIYLQNKSQDFYAKSIIEYCMNKPFITLSINLFTKENDKNFNFNFTESDLDINYLKYLQYKENSKTLKKQRFKLIINIYNKYNNINFKSQDKYNELNENIYYTNIDLVKSLKIEEIYFIRPSFYKNNIEKIYNQINMIEELKTMFFCLKNLEYSEEINSIYFSDNIIKNISLFYNETLSIVQSFNKINSKDIIFKNLKYIGINLNLMNKNIKNIIYNFFKYILSFIEYQDIINNNFDKDILLIHRGTLFINLEKNNIYNKILYEYFFKLFNPKNTSQIDKINKLIIVYDFDFVEIKNNNPLNMDNFQDLTKYKCFLPNLKEIIINNITNKISNKYITTMDHSKIFNIITFLCSNSHSLSSIILKDSFLPFNILGIFTNNNDFLNNIKNLEIISPSLNMYNYSTIIEKINNCKNLENILINTMSSNFNDSFGEMKISKNLKKIKQFIFNDFFEYINENNEIRFKQNLNIKNKELIEIFSEIIEYENTLETFKLNGFHYNFDKIKNNNVKYIHVNLEENDKDYKINQMNFKKINMKLNNFPNLRCLYVYVDILYEINNFIKMPIPSNLERIFLFASFINCDISILDKFLKNNGVELIVRNIESFNKSKILAYFASFPNNQ